MMRDPQATPSNTTDGGQRRHSERDAFDRLTDGLIEATAAKDGVIGLVLLGSASETGARRRDEWSDHDFFLVAEPGRGMEARRSLDWLPDPHRIVTTARDGSIGFTVLYDDGHVLEFALAEATELEGVVAGDASVVIDDAAATTSTLIARAQGLATKADRFDPSNDVRLALVKILIGVGRLRRGEAINGGQFIRTWVVNHFLRAIRGRFGDEATTARDTIDPTRRFEMDYPVWAAQISAALDQPAERAARDLFALIREILEPDWEDFPTAAANTVAHRLGWN